MPDDDMASFWIKYPFMFLDFRWEMFYDKHLSPPFVQVKFEIPCVVGFFQ